MNEVEIMYRNAHVYPRIYGDITKETFENKVFNFGDMCNEAFTAEKQLEIVKMILFSTWWMNLKRLQFSEKFDEGLAQMINELWQDLTEEERKQVKGILE